MTWSMSNPFSARKASLECTDRKTSNTAASSKELRLCGGANIDTPSVSPIEKHSKSKRCIVRHRYTFRPSTSPKDICTRQVTDTKRTLRGGLMKFRSRPNEQNFRQALSDRKLATDVIERMIASGVFLRNVMTDFSGGSAIQTADSTYDTKTVSGIFPFERMKKIL